MSDSDQEITIGDGRFRLDYKIAAGGFSQVFVGTDKKSGKQVAIKLEDVDPNDPVRIQTVNHEGNLYPKLPRNTFPRLYWMGRTKGDHYNALVTDLLGPSLRNVWVYCDKSFGLSTIYLIAIQALKRLEALHKVGIIHNDIKPSNFALGSGPQGNFLYLIDYGLATKWEDIETHEHVPTGFAGTEDFGTLRALRDNGTRSYRDDLESLGLTLIQLAKGRLPWEHTKNHTECIAEMERTTLDTMCGGLPELRFLMEHARSLEYNKKPDYKTLRKRFEKAHAGLGDNKSDIFDWVVRRYYRIKEKIDEAETARDRSLVRRRTAEAEENEENDENQPPRRRRRLR